MMITLTNRGTGFYLTVTNRFVTRGLYVGPFIPVTWRWVVTWFVAVVCSVYTVRDAEGYQLLDWPTCGSCSFTRVILVIPFAFFFWSNCFCDTICFLVLFCSICFPILISLLGPCNYWDFYWKNHNASVIHKINSVIAVGSVYFINLKTFLVK